MKLLMENEGVMVHGSLPGMPYSLPFISLPIVGSSAVSLPSFSLAGSPCLLDTYCTSLLT